MAVGAVLFGNFYLQINYTQLKLKNNGVDYLVIYENINKTEVHKLDIIKDIGNGEIKKLLSVIDLKKQFLLQITVIMKLIYVTIKIETYLQKSMNFAKERKKQFLIKP